MLTLTMLDVGQGESLILDMPDGNFALLDGGPPRAAERVLTAVGTRIAEGRRFQFAAATQWDEDHIGGLPRVLREFPPGAFVHAALPLDLLEQLVAGDAARRAVRQMRTVLRDLGVDSRPKFARDSIEIGEGLELSVLAPYTAVKHELEDQIAEGLTHSNIKRLGNRASLVFWCSAYGRSLLLPGELEDDQYSDLYEVFRRRNARGSEFDDPRAGWVKLSHHGGRNNNPIGLFQRFCGDPFVASASAGGRYGHPHPIVLKRLHFECGGRAMCTRLGQGCHAALTRSDLRAEAPEDWVDRMAITRRPNPRESCFGDIIVQISPDGALSVDSSSTRADCPYGGPASGLISLPNGRGR